MMDPSLFATMYRRWVTFSTDKLVVPHPCFRIDRFTDRAEKAKTGKVLRFGNLFSPLHEGPYRSGRCVKDGDGVLFNQIPPASLIREIRSSLVDQAGRSVGQWAVDDVGVTGDPATVCCAPVQVRFLDIEDISEGAADSSQVATVCVDDSLGFAGAARGVEDEEQPELSPPPQETRLVRGRRHATNGPGLQTK